jgi:hypothetical protein
MMEIRVVPDGGEPYDLTITSRDILAWEKVHKGMTFAKFQENINMGHLYDLAHRAATRTRVFSGNLRDFEESHDIDFLEDEEDSGSADPTNAGA